MADGSPAAADLPAAVPRSSRWVVACGLLVALAPGLARAQENELPTPAVVQGIPAGPFYLTPFFGLGVSAESNPFYQPQSQSDVVTRANPALGVMLPFLNSYVRAWYDAMFRRFAKTSVTHTNSSNAQLELSLLFNSFDRVVVLADRSSGASEVLRFDGGETTYDGTPFRFTNYTVGAERDVPGHAGYSAAVSYRDLRFDQTNVNFFEFHGYDAAADAYVPVSSALWVVAGASVRRYDHIRTDDPTGSVFRQENTDSLRLGVRGVLSGGHRFHVVLAYEQSLFPGGVGSEFKGIVGQGAVDLAVGPATTLDVRAGRRPWASFYGDNNYYLADTVGAEMRHLFHGQSDVGAKLSVGQSAYPDPVSIATGGPRRRDRDLEAEAYATLALNRWYGFRFSYSAALRRSNVDGVEYTAQTLGAQFVLGWR